MELPRVSVDGYRRITGVALWLLVFIVVTGAGVRLTGSGLGCSDWPTCENDRLVAPLEFHPMVEFVNRTITGLVSVAVALAVLGSQRRVPRRRDLTWLSLGLVGGVIAQIVLGAVVVKLDLNPVAVQGHFIVSMVLVANAVVLHDRAGKPAGPRRAIVTPTVRRLAAGLVGATALVILTGTAVTGAGPHAGDLDARRLDVAVAAVARVHSGAMFVLLAAVLAVVWMLRRDRVAASVMHAAQTMLTVLVLQAAVGYTQYFTEIPPLLVALHVLGATLVWIVVLRFVAGLSVPVEGPRDSGHDRDGAHRDGAHPDLVTN